MKRLFIVIPCYNEEDVIVQTTEKLRIKLSYLIKNKLVSKDSKVIYVDDKSSDNTWDLIKSINKKDKMFTGISLSKNRGQQNALLAGLLVAKDYADIVITLDADLQDDIDVIDEMIIKNNEGNEVVYGVRSSRKKDSLFKRCTAYLFYRFMLLMGVELIYNHADYRLMSKRVLDNLSNYKEVNLFLRGIVPLIGFKSDKVYYERKKRIAGKSKYSFKKMFDFAIDGITSFSVKPLRMICSLGFIILFVGIILVIYYLFNDIDKVSFLTISIWLIGGLQMISLGVIGEYIGKIFDETKRRPKYIIEENLIEEP